MAASTVDSRQLETRARLRRAWARGTVEYYLFLIIPTIVLLAVTLVPLLYAVYLTFNKWVLYRQPVPAFVGLQNYVEMLTWDRFWNSFSIQLVFILGSVALQVALGLGLALFLNREMAGRTIIRSLFLFPMVIPPVVAAFLWRFMLQSDVGVISYMLRLVGVEQTWLSTGPSAMAVLVGVDIWQFTPFVTLLLLAGLQQLPPELSDAAQVDGASSLQVFRFVILPLLMPLLLVVVILRIVEAFKVFPTIYVLTQGGPGFTTEALNYLAYLLAFDQQNMGMGATLSLVIMGLSILVAVAFVRAGNLGREQ